MVKSYTTQEERNLEPLENINPHVYMEDFERLAFEFVGMDHDKAVVETANAAAQVFMECAWPSVRGLAQKLRDEGPLEIKGWRFAATTMPGAWDLGFTVERGDEPGGWLYNCGIKPEQNRDGKEDERQYREKRMAEGAKTVDFVLESLRGGPRITPASHPQFYLPQDDCTRVSHLSVCGYERNGGMPAIYGKSSDDGDLDSLKASADFGSNYLPARVVRVGINPYLGTDLGAVLGDLARNPGIDSADTVLDIPSAAEVIDLLHLGLRAGGFSDQLRERTDGIAKSVFEQYGGEYSRTLNSIGAGTAFRHQGNIGEKLREACTDVWQIAAGADATHGLSDFVHVVRTLEAKGHTSRGSEYDCNDLDDFSFVERLDERRGILWLRNQQGQYRIDFHEDIDDGKPRWLVFSAQDEQQDVEDFEFTYDTDRKVSPDDDDFLARFRWDDEDQRFVMNYSGAFHSRTIKHMASVQFSIRSVSCCLEQDYPDAPAPNA